jgi:hypothetical protein
MVVTSTTAGEQLFRARAVLKFKIRLYHHMGYEFRHTRKLFRGTVNYQNIGYFREKQLPIRQKGVEHKLNMEVDLQSLFGLHVT